MWRFLNLFNPFYRLRAASRWNLIAPLLLTLGLLLAACGNVPQFGVKNSSSPDEAMVISEVFPDDLAGDAKVSYRLGLNLGDTNNVAQGQFMRVSLQENTPGDIIWSENRLPRLTFGTFRVEMLPEDTVTPPVFQAFVPVAPDLTPQEYSLQISFTGRTGKIQQLSRSITVTEAAFASQNLELTDGLEWLADHQADARDDAALAGAYQAFSPAQPWQRYWNAPLAVNWTLTTAFAEQRTYNGRPDTLYFHGGLDMAPLSRRDGDPVFAPAAGKVVFSGELEARGLAVAVDHGQGVTSYYFHLSQIAVEPGQSVEPGAMLGRVGSTGRSTGPHLHWEVRVHGVITDPTGFLDPAFREV